MPLPMPMRACGRRDWIGPSPGGRAQNQSTRARLRTMGYGRWKMEDGPWATGDGTREQEAERRAEGSATRLVQK